MGMGGFKLVNATFTQVDVNIQCGLIIKTCNDIVGLSHLTLLTPGYPKPWINGILKHCLYFTRS